jgi:hypothetical protein
MDIIDREQASTASDLPEAQREVVRQALDEIAVEIGIALRDANLSYPVYLTVPTSGASVATIATPRDPSDEDWSQASAIVCGVIGKRLGNVRLRGLPLPCAVANATMGEADLMNEIRQEP